MATVRADWQMPEPPVPGAIPAFYPMSPPNRLGVSCLCSRHTDEGAFCTRQLVECLRDIVGLREAGAVTPGFQVNVREAHLVHRHREPMEHPCPTEGLEHATGFQVSVDFQEPLR